MPFTPIHLGPGAAFKALGGRHFSFMVFGGAQVLMDIEPLVRMIVGTEIVHGFTHTYVGALLVGSLAGFIGRPISQFVLRLLNVPHYPLTWLASFVGAYIGTLSHVALDSVMHVDMSPWFPLNSGNATQGVVSIDALHVWCLALGVAGVIGVSIRFFARGRA